MHFARSLFWLRSESGDSLNSGFAAAVRRNCDFTKTIWYYAGYLIVENV